MKYNLANIAYMKAKENKRWAVSKKLLNAVNPCRLSGAGAGGRLLLKVKEMKWTSTFAHTLILISSVLKNEPNRSLIFKFKLNEFGHIYNIYYIYCLSCECGSWGMFASSICLCILSQFVTVHFIAMSLLLLFFLHVATIQMGRKILVFSPLHNLPCKQNRDSTGLKPAERLFKQ